MVRALAGGLGMLAFVAAIVVGSLAATGVISDAAQSFHVAGSEATLRPEAGGFEPKTVRLDRTLTAKDLRWTVETARQASEVEGFTFPPSPLKGRLVVVAFTVENVSDGPITLTPESLVLEDERGRESPPAASVNAEYVVPEHAILFNERGLLEPGEEQRGVVVYDLEVPFVVNPEADLSGLRLRLGDGDPTAERERYVDLGL